VEGAIRKGNRNRITREEQQNEESSEEEQQVLR
jgi:hypothetical protein